MKRITPLLLTTLSLALLACGNFPEKYENVIEDEKIRPLAIILDYPDAAPGDTITADLVMYDAGKDYTIDWELSLNFSVSNYGELGKGDILYDLDADPATSYDNGRLRLKFVIPTGDNNPLVKSSLVPKVIELSDDEREQLENQGFPVTSTGFKTSDLVHYLDAVPSIPAEFTSMIDQMVGLIVLTAKVQSSEFKLDVNKKVSVRYSNRLASGSYVNNVNRNPRLDAMGIISVKAKGMDDSHRIGEFEADTQYFSMNFNNNYLALGSIVDTFVIKDEYSYFLMADTAGAAQIYRSPENIEHKEQLFYQWFYTNLDKTNANWEDLIELGGDHGYNGMPVVYLKIPSNKDMHNFTIRSVVRDWRPEWAMLSAAGIGYLEARGYFKYQN